jgi:hypothetical protein
MYHPYFRGKQFELLTIRETAKLLADKNFVPIIEPVKESLGGLERTLRAIREASGKAVVIVNPYHGDHRESGIGISALLKKLNTGFFGNNSISAGILLRSDLLLEEATDCYDAHKQHSPTFVHAGFMEAKGLAEHLGDDLPNSRQVFVEDHAKLFIAGVSRAARVSSCATASTASAMLTIRPSKSSQTFTSPTAT